MLKAISVFLSNISDISIISNTDNKLVFNISGMTHNIQITSNTTDGLIFGDDIGTTYGTFRVDGSHNTDSSFNYNNNLTVYMSFSNKSFTLISIPYSPNKPWLTCTQLLSIGIIKTYMYYIVNNDNNYDVDTDSVHIYDDNSNHYVDIYDGTTKKWTSSNGTCRCSIFDTYRPQEVQKPQNPPIIIHSPYYELNIPHYRWFSYKNLRSYNTLDNSTMILPVYIYIKEPPKSKDFWGYLGRIQSLGCVNMYNMNNFHIAQTSYETSGDKYVCCSLNGRTLQTMMGVAVRLTDRLTVTEDDASVIPRIQ